MNDAPGRDPDGERRGPEPECRAAARDPVGEAARRLGVDYLYPVQRFVISNVLEGRGQIVVLPTGAGKSMCFQLPGLFLPGPTLVLLPLLSLMSDQQRRLARTGIPAGCLRGGLTPEQKNRLFAEIRSGRLRIILATPESCLVPSNLRALQACRVSHLVVDEAHCICEWGDSFRPAYRAVGDVCRQLCVPVVSAFTATASPPVIDRIRGALFAGREARVVAGSADRPNIGYAVVPLLSRGRALVELARNAVKPLLVFCRTRSGVEVGARIIHRRFPDVGVRFYHAGLDREERAGVESWFLRSTDGVLVATCAYGLGVDKPDIRTVAHADVPPSVEAYLQESGRAGRDGRASTALLMVSPDDAAFLSRLPEGVARDRFAGMLRYALGAGCRRNALLGMIGQAPVACSGCDWCSGRSCLAASGESEILRFVRRHAGRFDVPQAATILCAGVGPRQKRDYYDCIFGFGALEGWERADVEECLHSLVASGRLRLDGRGLIYQTVAPGTPL